MIRSIRGELAAAWLCLSLAACGGGGSDPAPPPPVPPTALPASVTIAAGARAEAGAAVNFKTSLTTTDGVTFLWDFGDGTTGADALPSHAYAKAGEYEVKLSLANSAEDLRFASVTVKVGNYANVTGLECTGTEDSGWCFQDALVTGHDIDAVTFASRSSPSQAGWAGGKHGTLLHSLDGGTTWTRVPTGVTDDIGTVRFRDESHGIAMTNAGYVLQSVDGGKTWTRNAVPDLSAIMPTLLAYDAQQIVIVDNQTHTSHDEGATWTELGGWRAAAVGGTDCWSVDGSIVAKSFGCTAPPVQKLFGDLTPTAVSFTSATHGMVVGMTWDPRFGFVQNAWTTDSGGNFWQRQDPVASSWDWAYQITLTDDNHAWLQSYGGWQTTADFGKTWTSVPLPASFAGNGTVQYGLVPRSNQLWISSATRLAVTNDYGKTWQGIPAPQLEGVLFFSATPTVVRWADSSHVVVVIDGTYYATRDAGVTWTRVLGPEPRDQGVNGSAIWFTDAQHGVLALATGTVKTTSDGGRTWSRRDYDTTNPGTVDLQFTSASEGWMMFGGALSKTTDGGATWNLPLVPGAMRGGVTAMSWLDANHGWVAAYELIYATTDGGQTWNELPTRNMTGGVVSMALEDAQTAVVVGNYAAWRTTDGGVTWQSLPTLQNAIEVRFAGNHTFWTTTQYDGTRRSTDDGATWTRMSLYASHPPRFVDDRHGYATSSTSLLSTDDGGDTWTASPIPEDVTLTSLFPLDSETMWGVTSSGHVLATATGGR